MTLPGTLTHYFQIFFLVTCFDGDWKSLPVYEEDSLLSFKYRASLSSKGKRFWVRDWFRLFFLNGKLDKRGISRCRTSLMEVEIHTLYWVPQWLVTVSWRRSDRWTLVLLSHPVPFRTFLFIQRNGKLHFPGPERPFRESTHCDTSLLHEHQLSSNSGPSQEWLS